MNKQLFDELVNSSTTYQTWQERYGSAKLPSFDRQKFYESTLQECIKVIEKVGILEQDSNCTMYVNAIKERFWNENL